MELTGGKTWKNSDTFTQRVFFDYLRDHPRETNDAILSRIVRQQNGNNNAS